MLILSILAHYLTLSDKTIRFSKIYFACRSDQVIMSWKCPEIERKIFLKNRTSSFVYATLILHKKQINFTNLYEHTCMHVREYVSTRIFSCMLTFFSCDCICQFVARTASTYHVLLGN